MHHRIQLYFMEHFIYIMRKTGKHIKFLPGVNYPVNAWNTGLGRYTLTDEGFFLHRCSIADPDGMIPGLTIPYDNDSNG